MLTQGWIGRWSPGIGDPGVLGWLTVAAYLAAAFLCWQARESARSGSAGRRRTARLWTLFAVGLFLLAINKQLDLQSALTEFGRILAAEQGWYEQRRVVQVACAVAVLIAAVAAVGWTVHVARDDLRAMRLTLAGGVLLAAFVVLRAASFHHIDVFIHGSVVGPVMVNHVLELGAITCIGVGARRFRVDADAP